MNGIIKRRKTSDYAQIHNGALQKLEDIRSIGLVAHIMSLPDSWVLKKMQLYSKFGRGPITNGIAELEEKKYWVDIKYRDGKKNLHCYHVSDIPFTEMEVIEFMQEVIDAGFKIMEISKPFQHLLSSGENDQLSNNEKTVSYVSSIAVSEQLMVNNSTSTFQNRQLLNKSKEINSNKQNIDKRNIVNLQEEINNQPTPDDFKTALINACSEYYSDFAPGRWSKQAWITLISTFINESVEAEKYITVPANKIHSYAYASLKNMAHSYDVKNGRKDMRAMVDSKRKVPLYNWLED